MRGRGEKRRLASSDEERRRGGEEREVKEQKEEEKEEVEEERRGGGYLGRQLSLPPPPAPSGFSTFGGSWTPGEANLLLIFFCTNFFYPKLEQRPLIKKVYLGALQPAGGVDEVRGVAGVPVAHTHSPGANN